MQPYPKANSELEEKISLTISRMAYVRTKSEKIERKKISNGEKRARGQKGHIKDKKQEGKDDSKQTSPT